MSVGVVETTKPQPHSLKYSSDLYSNVVTEFGFSKCSRTLKCCDDVSLLIPIRRDRIMLDPLRGEVNRLVAVEDGLQNVGCEECQADHLAYSAL